MPNQSPTILSQFQAFLEEIPSSRPGRKGLSQVSIKNYLSDIRQFIDWLSDYSDLPTPSIQDKIEGGLPHRLQPEHIKDYIKHLLAEDTPHSTLNRYLSSLRRFTTFLEITFQRPPLKVPPLDEITDQKAPFPEPKPHQNFLDRYQSFLKSQDLSDSTVKNYLSDANHFLSWNANRQNLSPQDLFTPQARRTYTQYLKQDQTAPSTASRRLSSLNKLTEFAAQIGLIDQAPQTKPAPTPSLPPLSWFSRHTRKLKRQLPSFSLPHPLQGAFQTLKSTYHSYHALPFTPYLHLALLTIFTAALAVFGYQQVIKQAAPSAAYPTAPQAPTRQLSFQGRLTDSAGTPITTSVNAVFKLYDDPDTGSQLYSSGTCSVDPDENGIFSILIGDGTCGSEIASSVFSENTAVYMEIDVGGETLSPRQQIATVAYALNTETVQGFPVSATESATANTLLTMNEWGEVILAEQSPTIKSVAGTFQIEGQNLTLATSQLSDGDITLNPDGTGQLLVTSGTTTDNSLRITNANLTSGDLISGYVGNDTATGDLLSLSSGSTETDRFTVGQDGSTYIAGALGVQYDPTNITGGVAAFNGNVGIGTTSPAYPFHVDTGSQASLSNRNGQIFLQSSGSAGDGNYGPGIIFSQADGSDAPQLGASIASYQAGADNNSTGLTFNIHNATYSNNRIEAMRIDNSGNIGIGTTNPSYPLQVSGDIYSSANIYGEKYYDISDTNYYLDPANGGDSLLTAGNIGVGTTNPQSLLHLESSDPEIYVKDTDRTGYSIIEMGANNFRFQVDPTNVDSTSNIRFDLDGTEIMRLDTGGNVGIGTTSPASKLDVSGSATISATLSLAPYLQVDAGTCNASSEGKFYYDANQDEYYYCDGSSWKAIAQGSSSIGGSGTTNYLPKWTGSTTLGDSLIYDDGTNIGIGTTTPSDQLVISDGTNQYFYTDKANNRLKIGISEDTSPAKTLELAGDINLDYVAPPDQSTFSLSGTTGGNLDDGATYYYSVAFVTSQGDTEAGYNALFDGGTRYKTIDLAAGETAVDITNIPTSPDPRVTGRKIYRSVGDESNPTWRYLVTTINDNTTTSYNDTTSDDNLDTNDTTYRKDNTTVKGMYVDSDIFAKMGEWNASFGSGSLASLTTGYENWAFGRRALQNVTSGHTNIAMGNQAGSALTTGTKNIFMGYSSMSNNTTGEYNTIIGQWTGRYNGGGTTGGSYNTALGSYALFNRGADTSHNTAVGSYAGSGFQGNYNTFLGRQAGYLSTPASTGDYNILIGYQTGDNAASGAGGNILIGRELDLPNASGTNQLSIGNLIYGNDLDGTGSTISNGNIGIGVSDPAVKLDVDGIIRSSTLSLGSDNDHNRINVLGSGSEFRIYNTGNAYATFGAKGLSIGNNTYVGTSPPSDGIIVSGNVGIGTTGPATILHIAKDGTLGSGTAGARTHLVITGAGGITTQQLQIGIDTTSNFSFLQSALPGVDYKALVLQPNGGNVGIGTTSPTYKLSVSDGTDELGLNHDGTDSYFKTTDGSFIFQTDEGTDTNTYLDVKGKGDSQAYLRLYDQDEAEHLEIRSQSGIGYIDMAGTSPNGMHILRSAPGDLLLFYGSTSGDNQNLKVHGYDTGASGVKSGILSVDAAGDFNIEAESGEILQLRTGGSDRLSILSNGNVGISTTSPSYKLSISDGTDELGLDHDGTDSYFKTTDGAFIFQTDEGTNTHGSLKIKSKGTGNSYLTLESETSGNTLQAYVQDNGYSYINSSGNPLTLQNEGTSNVRAFSGSSEGTTAEMTIWGYRTGDSKRSLEIGVGIDAANTASFDGLDNYYFDGNIGIGTSSPTALLDVGGGTYSNIDGTDDVGIKGDLEVLGTIYGAVGADDGTFDFLKVNRAATMSAQIDSDVPLRVTDTTDTETFRVDSDGNVGIGTTSPDSLLHVDGGTSDGIIHLKGGNAQLFLETDDVGGVGWRLFETKDGTLGDGTFSIRQDSNSADRFVIDSSGNIGIGTTEPGSELDVKGKITGHVPANGAYGLQFYDDTNGNRGGWYIDGGGNSELYLSPASGSNSKIDSAGDSYLMGGNVGIGTTSPSTNLDVAGSATISATLSLAPYLQVDAGACNASSEGKFYYDADNDEYYYCNGSSWTSIAQGASSVGGSGTQNYLPKWTAGTTLGDSQIFDDGTNVGIGIASPTHNLETAGSFLLGDNTGTGEINTSDWDIGTTGDASGLGAITADSTITFSGVGAGTDNSVVVIDASGQLYHDEVDSRVWGTSLVDGSGTGNQVTYWSDSNTLTGSNNFWFDGSNVGIGTTSPTSQLHLEGAVTGKALAIFNETGDQDIFTASASGTPKFTIKHSGNVGIGDTTPDHLLDLEGNLGLAAGSYINWGDTDGSTGYGIRDNSGSLEYKNSGGSWQNIGSGGGTTYWDLTSNVLHPKDEYGSVVDLTIGGTSTASAAIQLKSSGDLIATDTTPSFKFSESDATDPNDYWMLKGNNNDFSMQMYDDGTTTWTHMLYFDRATGNLGINDVTSPSYTLDVAGSIGATGDITGEKFIDVSNSNYLLDPAAGGTSLAVAGNVGIGTSSPTARLEIAGASSTISNDSGDITINSASGLISFAGDNLGNLTDIYASGNVGIGTTSPSEKLQVAGNIYAPDSGIGSTDSGVTHIAKPGGAALSSTGTVTGAIKITLPQTWTNTMMKMNVEIYDYSANESFTVKVGGYNYLGSTQWVNQFAQIIAGKSDRDFTVRFGHDGTKNAIWIGETGSSWNYLKVTVTDFVATHSNHSFTNWSDGWDISLDTDLTGDTITDTETNNLVSPWIYSGNDIYNMNSGNVGIGTTSPSYDLDVAGDIGYSGTLTDYSDIRLKENIVYLENSLDKIQTLKGFTYNLKTSTTTEIGLSAQDVQKVFPDAVTTFGPDDYLGLDYTQLVPPLVEATKELNSRTSTHSSQLISFNQDLSLSNIDNLNLDQNTSSTISADFTLTDSSSGRIINRIAALGEAVIANLKVGSLKAKTISTDSLSIAGQSLTAFIENIVSEQLASLSFPTSTSDTLISPLVETDRLLANTVETNLIKPQNDTDLMINLTGSEPSSPTGTLKVAGNASISGKLTSKEVETSTISAQTAYFDTVEADTIKAQNIEGVEASLNQIKSATIAAQTFINQLLAKKDSTTQELLDSATASATSSSQLLATIENSWSATEDGSWLDVSGLSADFATISDYLEIQGTTQTQDLFVNGSLITSSLSTSPSSDNQTLFIQPSGTGSINLLAGLMVLDDTGQISINGDLKVSGSILADNLNSNTATIAARLNLGRPATSSVSATDSASLLNVYDQQGQRVSSLNASGSAQFQDLTTSGLTIAASATSSASTQTETASNATIGTATLLKGESQLTIKNQNIKASTLVYLTPISNTHNQVLYVSSKQAQSDTQDGQFTVAVSNPAISDINFNYWLIQTQNITQATSSGQLSYQN